MEIFSSKNQNIIWSVCDKIFKRSCIENQYFDENLKLSEDQLFLWHVLKRINKFYYIPLQGYTYRMRKHSATRSTVTLKNGT